MVSLLGWGRIRSRVLTFDAFELLGDSVGLPVDDMSV
jgi:hypothetical protein